MKRYPKSMKFKSNHAIKMNAFHLLDKKTFFLLYGEYGIKSVESGKLTFNKLKLVDGLCGEV